jgi:hypothetical protein
MHSIGPAPHGQPGRACKIAHGKWSLTRPTEVSARCRLIAHMRAVSALPFVLRILSTQHRRPISASASPKLAAAPQVRRCSPPGGWQKSRAIRRSGSARDHNCLIDWWLGWDSNPRPRHYERTLWILESLISITCRVASVAIGTTEHSRAPSSHAKVPQSLTTSGTDPPFQGMTPSRQSLVTAGCGMAYQIVYFYSARSNADVTARYRDLSFDDS